MQQRRNPLIQVFQIPCYHCRGSASTICTTEGCQQNAFMCEKQNCLCRTKHINCNVILNINQLYSGLQMQRINLQNQSFIDVIIGIYNNMIEKLSDRRIEMIDLKEIFGVGQFSKQLIDLINFERQNEVDGKLGFKVLREINKSKVQDYRFPLPCQIQKQWKEIYDQQFDKILAHFQEYKKQALINRIQSKILDNIAKKRILTWLPTLTTDLELIYRGSEHSFSNKLFHEKCDGVECTIVVAQSDLGKIFGGYTPNKWQNKYQDQFIGDQTSTSFLFSISHDQKYPLLDTTKATRSCRDEGPMFGYWPTFYISNDKGRIHIDGSYRFQNTKINHRIARRQPNGLFEGIQPNGLFGRIHRRARRQQNQQQQHFNIKEYQVFKVLFK